MDGNNTDDHFNFHKLQFQFYMFGEKKSEII